MTKLSQDSHRIWDTLKGNLQYFFNGVCGVHQEYELHGPILFTEFQYNVKMS